MSAVDHLRAMFAELAAEIVEQITPELQAARVQPVIHADAEPLLLDWKQTSQRLGGLGETGVRSLWASGELPSVTIGRLRFTRAVDLREYVAALEPTRPGVEKPALSVVRAA